MLQHPSPKSMHSHQLLFAWLVWGLAALFYFVDYLARVAPGVMHRFLQVDFGINEASFGILTASFYIPYILMQIPVGLTVDRFSIRWLLTVMSLITALGCVVFGMALNLNIAALGRMLIGFSAAFAFVSSLRLAASWFPSSMLGLLAGLTQALGMLGAAAGEAPISFLVAHVGWRVSMYVIAVLFVVLASLLCMYVRDNPRSETRALKLGNRVSIRESLQVILTHRQTWLNALYAGFLFVPTAVIGESIGPAYLQYGRGLTAHQAAFATGLIFIGWGIGGPLSGWLSDKLKLRKPFIIASALLGLLLISLLVYCDDMNMYVIYTLFFVYGLTNTGVAIAYAVSTEFHEKSVVGTAIAFTNMASILIGAALLPVVGHLIDLFSGARSYHVELLRLKDFQAGLVLLPVCAGVALCLSFFIKETHGKPID